MTTNTSRPVSPSVWSQLFSSPLASVITVLLTGGFFIALYFLLRWGLIEAVFRPDFKACQLANEGACWGFVAEKWRLIIF